MEKSSELSVKAAAASVYWHAEWQHGGFVSPEHGFREGDENIGRFDPFRVAVVDHLIRLSLGDSLIFEGGAPGMPRSAEEARATNAMVEVLSNDLGRRIKEVEAQEPWRYRTERMMQTVMGAFMGNGKPAADPELAEIVEEAKREGFDWGQVGHLAKAAGIFFSEGLMGILSQIEAEEHSRSNTADGQHRILDTKWVDRAMHALAKRFIAGDTLDDVFDNKFIKEVLDKDIELTVAYEAESTFDPDIAQANLRSFKECIQGLGKQKEANPEKPQKKFMSMKLSALGFFEEDPEKTGGRLPPARIEPLKVHMRELLEEAMRNNVFIRIDMEYFIHKDATFTIFKDLLEENPAYADHLGVVFQAFLKDSPQDAEEMVAWASDFHARTGKRVSLRLVKGANIKADKKHAAMGLHKTLGTSETTWHGKPRKALNPANPEDAWDLSAESVGERVETTLKKKKWHGGEKTQVLSEPKNHPIAKDKETTQKQYLQTMKLFEENTDSLDVAYGTMNRDTIAHILQTWLNHGEDLSARQLQMLFGMYNSMCFALQGVTSQRRYVPYGLLGKILAYMGRRFVELKDSENGEAMPVTRYATYTSGPELEQVA